jgi:hypothetical protein
MKSESKVDKKSSIEQSALINEIIKRDNKYFKLNKNFHLDLTTCKINKYIKKNSKDNTRKAM